MIGDGVLEFQVPSEGLPGPVGPGLSAGLEGERPGDSIEVAEHLAGLHILLG